MNLVIPLTIAKIAYTLFLRKLLKKAIDDPEQEWDDVMLKALDTVLGHNLEGI